MGFYNLWVRDCDKPILAVKLTTWCYKTGAPAKSDPTCDCPVHLAMRTKEAEAKVQAAIERAAVAVKDIDGAKQTIEVLKGDLRASEAMKGRALKAAEESNKLAAEAVEEADVARKAAAQSRQVAVQETTRAEKAEAELAEALAYIAKVKAAIKEL